MWKQNRPILGPVIFLVLLGAGIPIAQGADLLGTEVWTHTLMRIHRDTAAWTPIGTFDVCTLAGLAYDQNHDVLYGIAPCTDNIYIISRETGAATCVGQPGVLGVDNANGLAYDPVHDILYATDNNTNTLLTVDRGSGVATVVAEISGGYSEIEGLGFDAADQVLYGITQLQRRIVSIDVLTGQAVAVSEPLPDLTWRGLDFDSERRLLYACAVNIFGDAPLYNCDPVSGHLTFVGNMVGAEAVQGLGFVMEASSAVPVAGDPWSVPKGLRVRCESRPNPFSEGTQIRFLLAAPGRVSLLILDPSGRCVRQLVDDLQRPAGDWQLPWNGRDDNERQLATGVYFYRLTVDGVPITRPLHLVR